MGGARKGASIVHGDHVREPKARVNRNTGGTARCVQAEHRLDGNVHGRGAEGLEHDLGHLLAVGVCVEGGFGKEDWYLVRAHSKLVIEGVSP